MTVMRH